MPINTSFSYSINCSHGIDTKNCFVLCVTNYVCVRRVRTCALIKCREVMIMNFQIMNESDG